MIKVVFFLIYGISNIPNVCCISEEYHLINISMSWTEAQQYCRRNFTDLATIESDYDTSRLPTISSDFAWIGLYDDPESWMGVMANEANSWRWSTTGKTSPGQYQNWTVGEPNYANASEECVAMENGSWRDLSCEISLGFVCYTALDHGQKVFNFINSTSLNWPSSRDYCRANYTELAMIEDETEHQTVCSLTQTHRVWIGLYRTPWRWSDGSTSTYKNWNGKPDNFLSKDHCAAAAFLNKKWGDTQCVNRFPFICHGKLKRVFFVKIKLQTEADLLDPTINAQLLKQLDNELASDRRTNLTWSTAPQKAIENVIDE